MMPQMDAAGKTYRWFTGDRSWLLADGYER
jgi:hypothetical protein